MDAWVYVVAAVAVAAAATAVFGAIARLRRDRIQLQRELLSARADVATLTDRIDQLSADVVETRRLAEQRVPSQLTGPGVAPYLITGLKDVPSPEEVPREAQLVHAIEVGRPQWVPARPLREALIKTVALGHGLRQALSADRRDRIILEMRAEVRRSRRQRKAEIKAARKYLRERRNRAA